MKTPIDVLATMATLDVQWKPHVVTQLDDYVVRVAKVRGDHHWHAHSNTDELFFVLGGELHLGVRDDEGERVVVLPKGAVYVVPKDIEHKPFSPAGADILIIANRVLDRAPA
jgi:mannose-6-phosphate isomerase-like protein (cupin superfamily)